MSLFIFFAYDGLFFTTETQRHRRLHRDCTRDLLRLKRFNWHELQLFNSRLMIRNIQTASRFLSKKLQCLKPSHICESARGLKTVEERF
jgi:hypothetical protein